MPQLPKRVCRLLDATLDPVPMNRPEDAKQLLEGIDGLAPKRAPEAAPAATPSAAAEPSQDAQG